MLTILPALVLPVAKAGQAKGTRLGLKLVPDTKATVTTADIEKARAVISSRLAALGINSASVEAVASQNEQLAVFLPPDIDLNHIKEVLTYFGRLELIPLVKDTRVPYLSRELAERAAKTARLSSYEIVKYHERDSWTGIDEGWVIAEKSVLVTGADFLKAQAVKSQYGVDQYEIAFKLNPEAGKQFADWTGNHIGQALAIVLNNEVISAPMVQGQIYESGQITGRFTRQAAEILSIALTSGMLPHWVEVVSQEAIK
jgi:preprotein translocase subunit SecD